MRKIISLLVIILLAIIVKAEYSGYHFKFQVVTIHGEVYTGYAYVAGAYIDLDSIRNTNYAKKALDQSWKDWDERDSLVFYSNRIQYAYTYVWDSVGVDNQNKIFDLTTRKAFAHYEIKSIFILEVIDFSYTTWISNTLSVVDTSWMNKEPVSRFMVDGYLCSHQVFVHKSSKKIEKIRKLLIRRMEEINGEENEYNEGDELDKEIWNIVCQLFGEKVVIVTSCSC
jgi:hypothetical protein